MIVDPTIAIRVSHLSKQYKLGGPQEPYHTFRDAIVNSLKAPMKVFHNAPPVEGFWALKDVSFDVEQGEIVGIIGRNGAGKSTLLKILSRITSPTEGTVELHGRVGSLLEVGTGFHPEMTGCENIFLNGSILGMKKVEIEQKFDEIVKFAEIDKFIDTPVKRYSSGMFVRLAFAVAAHLEPEILLVDEVLAVGDVQFQKKCLGKMREVSEGGRTILFVSHNMEAVSTLCTKGIILEKGHMIYQDDTINSIEYYNNLNFRNDPSMSHCLSRGGSGGIKINNVIIINERDLTQRIFFPMDPIIIRFQVLVGQEYKNGKEVSFGIGIDSSDGVRIFTGVSSWNNNILITPNEDLVTIQCKISNLPVIQGKYLISISALYQLDTLDCIEHCASFEIIDNNQEIYAPRTKKQGYLQVPYKFEIV